MRRILMDQYILIISNDIAGWINHNFVRYPIQKQDYNQTLNRTYYTEKRKAQAY